MTEQTGAFDESKFRRCLFCKGHQAVGDQGVSVRFGCGGWFRNHGQRFFRDIDSSRCGCNDEFINLAILERRQCVDDSHDRESTGSVLINRYSTLSASRCISKRSAIPCFARARHGWARGHQAGPRQPSSRQGVWAFPLSIGGMTTASSPARTKCRRPSSRMMRSRASITSLACFLWKSSICR